MKFENRLSLLLAEAFVMKISSMRFKSTQVDCVVILYSMPCRSYNKQAVFSRQSQTSGIYYRIFHHVAILSIICKN